MSLEDKDLLKLENQLCHKIYVINNKLTRTYRPYLEKIGLTYPQYIVMLALWQKDKVFIRDLGNRTMIDQGSLSLIVKKLENKNYITLSSNQSDRRLKSISLTENGKMIKEKAKEIPKDIGKLFKNTESEEFEKLRSVLGKMNLDLDSGKMLN